MFRHKNKSAEQTVTATESDRSAQATTVAQAETAAPTSMKRGTGWMDQDEKVLGEFNGAHLYSKSAEREAIEASFNAGMKMGSLRFEYGSAREARMSTKGRDAQNSAKRAKDNAMQLRVNSAKTIVTNKRLVLLGGNEEVLFELPLLELQEIKRSIQGVRASNEEAKKKTEAAKENKGFLDRRKETNEKYGYKADIKWLCDVAIDNSMLKTREVIITCGHFSVDDINRFFNPKYSDGTMHRGWKYTPGKGFIYGQSMGYNIKLSEPEKAEELISLLRSRIQGVNLYTQDKTEMIVDFLGRRPTWLV